MNKITKLSTNETESSPKRKTKIISEFKILQYAQMCMAMNSESKNCTAIVWSRTKGITFLCEHCLSCALYAGLFLFRACPHSLTFSLHLSFFLFPYSSDCVVVAIHLYIVAVDFVWQQFFDGKKESQDVIFNCILAQFKEVFKNPFARISLTECNWYEENNRES